MSVKKILNLKILLFSINVLNLVMPIVVQDSIAVPNIEIEKSL